MSSIEDRLKDYAYDADGDDRQFRILAYGGGDYDYIIRHDIHVDDIDLTGYDTRSLSEDTPDVFIEKIRDITFNLKNPKIEYSSRIGSAVARSERAGLILINNNTDLFNKEVLDHEIGHQLSDISDRLQKVIIENPGNIFGYFDKKYMKFVGILGEYSPEEAFATSCSYYINHRSFLKSKYPDTYRCIESLFANTNAYDIYNMYYELLDINMPD